MSLKLRVRPIPFVLCTGPVRIRWRNFKLNAVIFLWLGPPSTLIRRKRSFSKASFKPMKLENIGFSFRKHFENEAFRELWRLYNNVISLPEFSSTTTSKMTGYWCAFNSYGENSVFYFLWRWVRRGLKLPLSVLRPAKLTHDNFYHPEWNWII